jgi:ferredoxin-nitrite reductase
VIPNKPDAINLTKYLEEKVPLESDSKIRMYWSGCVKGCGLHDLGDIGFEGCKAKVDGASEYGVHIFLGGRTTRDARMGYSVLKGVPLRFVKYYVESLMLEYKRLKQKNESFEGFNTRVLNQYTRGAVGFMMILLAYIRINEMDIKIGFKENVKTGKNENFEIFEIGRVLYKTIMKSEPYELIDTFTPIFPRVLHRVNAKKEDIDESFAQMINDMLKEKNRAMVFSELNHFIEIST